MNRTAVLAMAIALAAPTIAAAAQPPAPTAVAAAPTAAPDPARLALAHKLIDASNGRRNAELMIGQMYGSMSSLMPTNLSAEQQHVIQALQADMQREMLQLIPIIMDQSAQAYARNLSEKELTDMLAWQTSESGQSISRKLPAITQEVLKAELPYLREMMPRMLQKAMDHACDEANCTAEQREQVAQIVAAALAKRPS
jgi:hypothetical protein